MFAVSELFGAFDQAEWTFSVEETGARVTILVVSQMDASRRTLRSVFRPHQQPYCFFDELVVESGALTVKHVILYEGKLTLASPLKITTDPNEVNTTPDLFPGITEIHSTQGPFECRTTKKSFSNIEPVSWQISLSAKGTRLLPAEVYRSEITLVRETGITRYKGIIGGVNFTFDRIA